MIHYLRILCLDLEKLTFDVFSLFILKFLLFIMILNCIPKFWLNVILKLFVSNFWLYILKIRLYLITWSLYLKSWFFFSPQHLDTIGYKSVTYFYLLTLTFCGNFKETEENSDSLVVIFLQLNLDISLKKWHAHFHKLFLKFGDNNVK